MTRKKEIKAKNVQSHGQENFSPAKASSSARSPAPMPDNLKRSLPEDAVDISARAKKQAGSGFVTKARSEADQTVRLSPDLKRPRQDEYLDTQASSAKKAKKSQIQQRLNADPTKPSASGEASGGPPKIQKPLETVSKQLTSKIPGEVQHLTSQYDLTSMSIISSSKMEQKIRNVLERVGRFSFSDAKAKPGVVILHAQARNASKMVTIAELSKREIEKDEGKWWQYTKIEGQVMEMNAKPRKPKPRTSGKTLANWEAEQESSNTEKPHADTEMEGAAMEPITYKQPDDPGPMDLDHEEEDEDETFETMVAPAINHRATASSDNGRRKVRAVSVMTIYLARVPVPGLRELYG